VRVLVTGASGFIGANLTALLKAKGIETRGVDSFSVYYSPEMKNSRIINLQVSDVITNLDIRDYSKLDELLKTYRPNVVVHLAAQGGVRASRTDPSPYISTNQEGFFNVLNLSQLYGVEKLIYASSSSVYGDLTTSPFREDAVLAAPKSLYALSKMSNEIMAEHLPGQEMQRIGLRLFTVYGPWGRPDMAMFRLLASCRLKEKFQLTANLDVLRDFTFVDDTSTAIYDLIVKEISTKKNEIFNIAGGKPYSLQNLLEILSHRGNNPVIENREHDPLDVRMTHGSTEKIIRFGITVPQTSLSDGVNRTIEWIESQDVESIQSWYEYSR
jgi:UDP-glucuronate 4-epimerase